MGKKEKEDPLETGPAIICEVTTPDGVGTRMDKSSGYVFRIRFLPKMLSNDRHEYRFTNLEHLLKFMYGRGYIVGKYTKADGTIDENKLKKVIGE